MNNGKNIANEKINVMYKMLSRGQETIGDGVDILASSARRLSHISAVFRVILISFGAIAATHGVATKIRGEEDAGVLIAYTIVGLIIATLAGLEAVFRFEQRATALRVLATEATAKLFSFRSRFDRQIDVSLLKNLGQLELEELQKAANIAREILSQQDQYFIEMFRKATELGVNFPLELREMAEKHEEEQILTGD